MTMSCPSQVRWVCGRKSESGTLCFLIVIAERNPWFFTCLGGRQYIYTQTWRGGFWRTDDALAEESRVVLQRLLYYMKCNKSNKLTSRPDRSMDLTMLEIQNSRERELSDWELLFRDADSRFEFLGGSQPIGSHLWILKARWNAN